MKKLRPLFLFASFIFSVIPSFSQVLFYEDFGGVTDMGPPYNGSPNTYGPTFGGAGTWTFAPGFFKRNVDNLTPAAAVNYVNEAWEIREDFNFNVTDACAFSTSWYTPAGTANDFMWTPLIGPLPANSFLSWNAVTYDPLYPDGYEVRIMTSSSGPPTGGSGVIGNQITSSTVVFSTGAEATAWVNHQVSLASYTGQSIYVGFRNNSNDKFLLLIDDIKVEVITNYDAQVLSIDTVTEYTLTPKSQTSPLPLGGTIKNGGVMSITNVAMKVNVYDPSMTQIYTTTSPTIASLAPGAVSNFIAGTWTPPTAPGTYTLKFFPVLNETDGQASNDTITTSLVITDSVYARDDGTVVGQLGIGAGTVGYLGQEFAIYNPARLTSISTYVTQGYTGAKYGAVVWDMSGGYPSSIVAYTDTLFYPDDSADLYTMPMYGGDFTLAPGNYVVTMVEFDSTLAVGLTNSIFTTNRTFVDWATNPFSPWGNNEDYGASFAKSYVIRPTVLPPCPADIITGFSTTTAGCGLSDGTASVSTVGSGPFTYNWSSGGNAVTESGLAAGTYMVTVIDAYSTCSEVDTVTVINSNAPTIDSVTTNDPLCFSGNTGSASAFVSGGIPGYTYLWTGGQTTPTAVNLGAGSYTLTVTDTANCQATSTFTLTAPSLLTSSASGTPETCAGCNDGSATATPLGGTAGYTYAWAPSGGTAATATGLTPGTYTVTVTDANGCTTTSTFTVAAFNGIEDAIGLFMTNIYPNPSNGQFTINGTITYTGDLKIEMVNVLGEVVFNKTLAIQNQINTIIEVHVKPAPYTLKLTAGNYSITRQLIIQ